jgi:hypothetical protein
MKLHLAKNFSNKHIPYKNKSMPRVHIRMNRLLWPLSAAIKYTLVDFKIHQNGKSRAFRKRLKYNFVGTLFHPLPRMMRALITPQYIDQGQTFLHLGTRGIWLTRTD